MDTVIDENANTLLKPFYNIEAEMGVLGALMIEETVADDIIRKIDKSYFLNINHQAIFEAITTLLENHKPLIVPAILEEVKKKGNVSGITEEYLVHMMTTVNTPGSALYYTDILRRRGILRLLTIAAQKIISNASNDKLSLDQILGESEQLIFDVTQRESSSEPVHIQHLLKDVIVNLEKENYGFSGIPTGFYDLDQMISGLQKSALIIIAARPSMGKTSFALNIASHVGVNEGKGVLIFSIEMSKEQVAQNMVCSRARVSPHKIVTGNIDSEDYAHITAEAGILGKAPIFIDDTPSVSLREIRGKARRYKSQYNLGLIIIDYIQLMEANSDSENRQQEISKISRGLKSIARELEVPVIALSQLNRAVDARDDHKPRMSDLRESGALEQDADLIMFLYRDEYYFPDSQRQGIAEVIVAKHRNGPTGSIDLYFFKQYMRFVSMAKNNNPNNPSNNSIPNS